MNGTSGCFFFFCILSFSDFSRYEFTNVFIGTRSDKRYIFITVGSKLTNISSFCYVIIIQRSGPGLITFSSVPLRQPSRVLFLAAAAVKRLFVKAVVFSLRTTDVYQRGGSRTDPTFGRLSFEKTLYKTIIVVYAFMYPCEIISVIG